MMRADHPIVKRGGVCAFIGESLPVCNFSNSNSNLNLTNLRALLLYIDLLVKHLIMKLTLLSAM